MLRELQVNKGSKIIFSGHNKIQMKSIYCCSQPLTTQVPDHTHSTGVPTSRSPYTMEAVDSIGGEEDALGKLSGREWFY